jgi:CBS domain-containing protein
VGIGGWINPAVLGVGYDNIHALVNGTLNMHESAALLIGKCVVWIAALSSGTSGGVLAPLLIMGGALGALEAHFLPFADVGFWAILGMAAILGGTMRAPLTATLFAVELTGNHDLLLPVLVAATAAFATTVLLMPRSILTERIARRGHHIMREYSIDPFLQTRVEQIMAKPAHTLAGSISIEQAIAFFMAAEGPKRHKSYPVVNADGKLVGIVSRADILRWSREGWDGNVNTLADAQRDAGIFAAYGDELVGHLADRMAVADLGRVPILERGTDRVVGVVARRDLLRVRARVIKEERERRRMLKFG